MVVYFDTEHPKDTLLFYVAGRADETVAARVGAMIDGLASARDWVIHPPYFVHQTEDFIDPETGKPVETIGGVLEFYSAHPPWRDRLPAEVDRAHYLECRSVVDRLLEISRELGIEFHFEFQGELVGAITAGQEDDRLGRQFLGTWSQAVGIRSVAGQGPENGHEEK